MNTPDPLAQLRDIHLPDAPGFWPPAPGWWLLALIALILLALALRQLHRQRRAGGYRRLAQQELKRLKQQYETNGDTRDYAKQLNALLKRTALMKFPREQVAALHGQAWLEFLDQHSQGNQFCRGPGKLLPALLYSELNAEQLKRVDVDALNQLSQNWIKNHR